MKTPIGAIALLSASLVASPALAQIPNPNPPRPPQLPEPELLPPPSQLLEPPTGPTPTQQIPTIPGTLTVNRFELVGNTVFSQGELEEIFAPYLNRPISFPELLEIQDTLTQLYINKGYVTSGAFIPPQVLNEGTIIIEAIEGTIETIEVTVNGRLDPDYIRSRAALGAKTPFNVNKLVDSLRLLQLNPLIESISAELAPGIADGTSILTIEAEIAPPLTAFVGVSNNEVASVGTLGGEVGLGNNNLLGIGDSFNIVYTHTEGRDAISEANYTIPLNARNGTLGFSFRLSDNRIVREPFDELDIDSKAREYELTYRQPLLQSPSRELAFGFSAARKESDTQLLGEDFPISPGANERGETRVSAIRFFQEWVSRGRRDVLAARSQFSLGVDALDASINKDPPDGRFFSWRGQAQYLREFAPDTILLLRSDLQLADRTLVPIEQFGIGGGNSVRGYAQDAILADNGIFASAEMRVPVVRIPQWHSVVQLTPFADIGAVWNSSGKEDPDPNVLPGVGLGVLWTIGDKFSARFDWGIPLKDTDGEKNSWQENGLYFKVEFKP